MISTKAPVETEIDLMEAPVEIQAAVGEKLEKGYVQLSVIKVINFPYKDKERGNTTYKAYMRLGNLMLLLRKWDFMDEVLEDSMTAGDIKQMNEYWNNLFK